MQLRLLAVFAVVSGVGAADAPSGLTFTSAETKAAHVLFSQILPAEIQVKSACYQDADNNAVGEYMFLAQLAGRVPTNKLKADSMHMLTGPLADGLVADGFRFAAILPGGDRGLVVEEEPTQDVPAAGAAHRERFFAAMAWPVTKEQGSHAFLMMPDGRIRYAACDGTMPAATAAIAYDAGKGSWSSPWPEVPRGVVNSVTYPAPAQ